MTVQIKREPLEFLHLDSVTSVIDTYTALYSMGYRGALETVGDASARMDMSLADNIPVAAAVGDVILYRAQPVQVVACMTWDDFLDKYEAVV